MKEIINQLSKREKRLLYILMCFLIVIGGWFFVVVPSIDSYQNVCSELETTKSTETSLDSELQKYLAAPDLLATKQDSYNKITEKYNPLLTNEKIDKLITTAMLSQGFKPLSLTIENGANSEGSTQETSDSILGGSSDGSLQQATVSVTVEGNLTQLTKTIAYLNDLKGIHVSKINYSDGSSNSSSNISMTIVVYMIEK